MKGRWEIQKKVRNGGRKFKRSTKNFGKQEGREFKRKVQKKKRQNEEEMLWKAKRKEAQKEMRKDIGRKRVREFGWMSVREIARKRGVRKKGRPFRRREIKLGRKSMAEREEGYLEKKDLESRKF